MKENPLVSIVILNFNSGNLLSNCVDSIKNSKYSNYEIIVVDNASEDESISLCKQKFSDIKFIENKKNLGFSEGNNIGIKKANGKFILILNPDTIVKQNWLDELLNAYQINGEGLYQPKLLALDDKSRINSAGNMIQVFGFGFSRGKGETDKGQYDSFQQIGFASGACLFTSMSVMEKIGCFESFLFAYNEDMDLGWRAAKMGINSYYVPSSVVYHKESYSHGWSPEKFFLLERNRIYCLKVHYSNSTIKKLNSFYRIVEASLLFYFLTKGMLRKKLNASSSIKQNKKFIEKKHIESENMRKISDSEIIKNFVDEIYVPKDVSNKFNNRVFNWFLRSQTRRFRKQIK